MKIASGNKIAIAILQIDEYKQFYSLINANRDRLADFFPVTVGLVKTEIEAKNYLRDLLKRMELQEFYPFGIYRAEELIGYIAVKNIDWRIPKAELGYYIDGSQEGKGIMSGVLKATIKYCFQELRIRKLFLRISGENHASIRVAEKNGFALEGNLRDEFRLESGRLIDVQYYGLLK